MVQHEVISVIHQFILTEVQGLQSSSPAALPSSTPPSTPSCVDDEGAAAPADEEPLRHTPELRLHAGVWRHSADFSLVLWRQLHAEYFIALNEFLLIED